MNNKGSSSKASSSGSQRGVFKASALHAAKVAGAADKRAYFIAGHKQVRSSSSSDSERAGGGSSSDAERAACSVMCVAQFVVLLSCVTVYGQNRPSELRGASRARAWLLRCWSCLDCVFVGGIGIVVVYY